MNPLTTIAEMALVSLLSLALALLIALASLAGIFRLGFGRVPLAVRRANRPSGWVAIASGLPGKGR